MTKEDPDIYKDGHIDVAHPIAKKWAKYRISGEEWQILWVIMEKTWGWHKPWDKISIKQFHELTEMKKPSIIRAIKKLISKHIVSKRANKNISSYHINSHLKKWKSVSKKANVSNIVNGVSKKANGVSKRANFQSPKPSPKLKQRVPKETITKETITKENIYTLFEYWNSLKIIIHRDVSKFKPHLNAALERYSLKELKEAMFNYKTVLESDRHFWTYKWGLEEFLSRKNGVDKFLTVNNPLENFLKKGEKHAYTTKNEKTPKDWGFGLDRTKKNR